MSTTHQAELLRRAESAAASIAPGYVGYDDKGGRRRSEEAVRRAAAASVRGAAGSLADWQRVLTGPGELGYAVRVERLITRTRHTTDRLEAAPRRLGRWFGDKNIPVDARLALALADRELLESARELADTARAGAGAEGHGVERLEVLRESLDEVRRQADDRNLLLADDTAPKAPAGQVGADAFPGETVLLEGTAHLVLRRSLWPAGDVALDLEADSGHLLLWSRPTGELIAFEAQALDLPNGPADRIAAADQEFELTRHDTGILYERDALGRHRREAERWLYQGRGGVWLWIESRSDGLATMRGVPVSPEELALE